MTFHHTWHEWLTLAERGVLRLVMMAIGFGLMIVGHDLGASTITLPPGLFVGYSGLGLVVWGALGELPIHR